jgi:hypothetical protein
MPLSSFASPLKKPETKAMLIGREHNLDLEFNSRDAQREALTKYEDRASSGPAQVPATRRNFIYHRR